MEEIKPEEMGIEELKKVVGPFYEYDERIKVGKINARNMEPREIIKIDIKETLSVNIYSLNAREGANRKRR